MDAKEFREHQLWNVVSEVRDLAKGLDPSFAAELTDRIAGISSWVDRFRRLAETQMFSPSMLSTAEQQWTQLRTYVSSIPNSSSYVQHATNQLDAIVSTAAGWPQPWTSNRLSQAMQDQLQTFAHEIDDIRRAHLEQLAALETDLADRDREIAELKEQATAIQTKLAEQDQAIGNQLTSQTTTFNASLTEQAKEFMDWMAERKGDLAKLHMDNASDLEAALAETKKVQIEAEKIYASVETVASKAGSAVLARDYNGYAKQQMISSWVSFLLGLLLLVVAGIFLYRTASSIGPEVHATWQWVVIKVGIAATLAGGASFTLTLGNRFLRSASTAKRMELELRVLGPFLAEMDPVRSQDILADFADRSFGRPWEAPEPRSNKDEDIVNVNAVAQVGEMAARIVAAAQKAG